jgi:hypothetical protein
MRTRELPMILLRRFLRDFRRCGVAGTFWGADRVEA